MATKKAAPKKAKAKKPTPNKNKFKEILYLNRTPEAIAEFRSDIVNTDLLAHLNDIDEDFKALLKSVNKCIRPTHEDSNRWKIAIEILNQRSKNAHKLLNKVVPDFKEEELTNVGQSENAGINPEAAREQAFAKLAKALKPKSKVSNIKTPK
jgi:hypothetical protein